VPLARLQHTPEKAPLLLSTLVKAYHARLGSTLLVLEMEDKHIQVGIPRDT
jgi:hypothetical protein